MHERPRSFHDGLAFCPADDRIEHLACIRSGVIHRSIERGDAGVLVLRFQRDIQQFGRIRKARDRVERGLRVKGMPGNAAERLRLVHAAERRGANRVVRRGFRNRGELPRIVESVERQRGSGIGRGRRDGDFDEAIRDGAMKIGVLFGARQTGEYRRIADAIDGGGADANVGVRRGQFLDCASVFLVVRDLGDRGGADRRIRVLPAGLRLESVEERHREPCTPLQTRRITEPVIRAFEIRGRLTARFLSEPLGDLFPRPPVIVIQMHDHRCQRQPL